MNTNTNNNDNNNMIIITYSGQSIPTIGYLQIKI